LAYILDINNNDDLELVRRKCNTNFRAIVTQLSKQTQDAADSAYEDVSEAVTSLVQLINQEAGIRAQADLDLENEIQAISITSITNAEIDIICAN
jgi:hypothetical protein